MKFKDHIMFITPLMAILISIQFVIIFDRFSSKLVDYTLNNSYILFMPNKKDKDILAKIKSHSMVNTVENDTKDLYQEVIRELKENEMDIKDVKTQMPMVYKINLNRLYSQSEIKEFQKFLTTLDNSAYIESFKQIYKFKYYIINMFDSSLNIFIFIIFIISILLIIKQMEVWQLAHKERMQIMEIFGAPLILRSGILFGIAIIDSIIATILNLLLFLFLRLNPSYFNFNELLTFVNGDTSFLFYVQDLFIWLLISFIVVFISVTFVALRASEVIEK